MSDKKKILLIGWDAADWEHINPLLEQGLLPHLEKFINSGVMGNLATLQPILSPMLWNSAATGKYAFKHGIHGFTEPDKMNGGYRPFSSYSRRCKALWNIFSQQGYRSNVINWWASHPAEPVNGCVVSNLVNGVKFKNGEPVVSRGTVHPEEKAKQYAQFRVLPNEIEAEQICAFIPRADEILQEEDSRLQMFANVFSETMTTHGVATEVMQNEPWDFMAVYYTSIDHFCHGFMDYHPPRSPHVSDRDFEIFKDVIKGAYRFSDMMLARLLQLAGEDTIVLLCSDHGFYSGTVRPKGQPREPAGPAIWHRPYGVFLMKGPGIKKDELIYGASLIDIAPTILTAAGLPVGKDMDGRPLLEVFENPPEVKTIPSWEDVDGPQSDGMHAEELPMDPAEAEQLVEQFVALGYIDDPVDDKQLQFISAETECSYNLARNYLFAGLNDQAIPLFEEILTRSPWETRFIVQLVQAYQRAGYLRQAVALIEKSFDIDQTAFQLMVVVWVEIQLTLGEVDRDELAERLLGVEQKVAGNPVILGRVGKAFARMRNWDSARRCYEQVIDVHPENAQAWQGLSRVYLRMGKNKKVIDAALAAVSLIHRLPHSHLNLGIALARSRKPDKAIAALKMSLQFSPAFVPAHRALAVVYRTQMADQENGDFHSRLAAKYSLEQTVDGDDLSSRIEELFELPEIPTEAQRNQTLIRERPGRTDPRKPSGKTFVLVSGLPRSGTSVMMQMLEAGGLAPKTDGVRTADEDNPRGYYEWEEIKKIKSRPDILLEEGLEQKVIKAVTMVLADMPYTHNYKIIFMVRSIDEILASQSKMIQRRGTDSGDKSDQQMKRELLRHRNFVRRRIGANPRMDVLDVEFASLINDPQAVAKQVADFLGPEYISSAESMAGVVSADLHRQK